MPVITFLTPNGSRVLVDAPEGISLMQAAVQNMVPGITADCGGEATCATCHVFVEDDWFEKTGGAVSDLEKAMLLLAENGKENSRLACQIKLSPDLDGLIVMIPERVEEEA